jgi:hypothetical protein
VPFVFTVTCAFSLSTRLSVEPGEMRLMMLTRTLDAPTIGSFKDRRGEFYDQEAYRGRTILVRYVWTGTASKSPHFEQSFSDDGGKTWEVNWITDQVRVDG